MPTTFCPACETHRPADAFQRVRRTIRGDISGATLRCDSCAIADAKASRFVAANRTAIRNDPEGFLARRVTAVRKAQHAATRRAHLYAFALAASSEAALSAA